MKRPLVLLAVMAVAIPSLSSAQTNTPSTEQGGAMRNRLIGFLPQQQQDRVIAAYHRAIATSPGLKSQEEKLRQSREDLGSASKEERRTFREDVRKFQQKLRSAMLKDDPTLKPTLDQIDQHISEMRSQQERQLEQNGASDQ